MVSGAQSSRRDWLVYHGDGRQHDHISDIPAPPPWRRFDTRHGRPDLAHTYQIGAPEIDAINVAIHLRRPLLVTGKSGTGKTALADSIAYELGLGLVLKWSVNSRSSLAEGLYNYDALAHFQAVSAPSYQNGPGTDIGQYVRLGPLGTAFLPGQKPRVLLIDEFDKSDLDLPTDLLTLFDEGQFFIAELERLPADHSPVEVFTADHGERVRVHAGRIGCHVFPLVVITSNQEREFPPSFTRRCVRLELRQPGREKLDAIVTAHFGAEVMEKSRPLLDRYAESLNRGEISTDQFLNAIYLIANGPNLPEARLSALLLRPSGPARP